MAFVDARLVRDGVIDSPAAVLDNRDERYEGLPHQRLPAFSRHPDGALTDDPDRRMAAGRNWQGTQAGSDTWLRGGPWASRNTLWCKGATTDGTALGTCAVNCTNDHEVYSFHSGGANVALADGSVHFLSASIDIRVFAALVTRAGGEVVATDF
ncbi:MAG: H-X9-DG-CTERM domain-containing protein [Planctomycetaceae bacterium]